MSVRVFDALADGIDRTLARNGLLLAAAFYAVFVVQTLFASGGGTGMGVNVETGPSPVIGGPVSGAFVGLVTSLLSLYLVIVALRTFVTDERETVPDAALRDRPVWALVNLFVGLIVFGLAVGIGFFLLIVPGFFLLVTLWFFDVYVAVEDDDFVTGMRRSWSLTSGNRLPLFGLGVGVFLVTIAISVPFGILETLVGGLPGALLSQIAGAFALVYIHATTAVAFTQLRDSEPDATGHEPARTDDEPTRDDHESARDDDRSHSDDPW